MKFVVFINHWINKYNNNYINMTIITPTAINDYKQNNIHKSIKRYEFYSRIIDYVNNNKGCSLASIRKDATVS